MYPPHTGGGGGGGRGGFGNLFPHPSLPLTPLLEIWKPPLFRTHIYVYLDKRCVYIHIFFLGGAPARGGCGEKHNWVWLGM